MYDDMSSMGMQMESHVDLNSFARDNGDLGGSELDVFEMEILDLCGVTMSTLR